MTSYSEDDGSEITLDRERLLSFGIIVTEEIDAGPEEKSSLSPLIEMLDSKGTIVSADVISFLPRGIQDDHARGMRDFLYDLDWMCSSVGLRGLTEEYARRISYGHILAIAEKLVRFDEETKSRIAFPEWHLGSEEERQFYVRHPDCVVKLWKNVCSYLVVRYPAFESNVASVSTFFYLAQEKWSDVVELSSLALMRHRSVEYARRGEFNGIVRSVRLTEAEVLSEAIAACKKTG